MVSCYKTAVQDPKDNTNESTFPRKLETYRESSNIFVYQQNAYRLKFVTETLSGHCNVSRFININMICS